jgi:hypothetical protein
MATDTIAEVVETEAQPTDGNVEVLETETPPAKKVKISVDVFA